MSSLFAISRSFIYALASTSCMYAVSIAVDYNDEGSNATQPGFIGQSGGSEVVTTTVDSVTLSVFTQDNDNGRNRSYSYGGSTKTPEIAKLYVDLLTDLQHTSSLSGDALPGVDTLTFTGLPANADYEFRVWSYDADSNGGAVSKWYDTTNGTGAAAKFLGEIVNRSGPDDEPVNISDFSIAARVTSSPGGVLNIGLVQTAGLGQINAVALVDIPEPAAVSAILGALALCVVGLRRRR